MNTGSFELECSIPKSNMLKVLESFGRVTGEVTRARERKVRWIEINEVSRGGALEDFFKIIVEDLGVLKRFHILDENYQITEIGDTYHKYGEGIPAQEDDFPPPWRDMAEISSAISASTSFAEAFTETAKEEPLWDVKEDDIVNLADQAKKSASFAELISKQMKDEEKDD